VFATLLSPAAVSDTPEGRIAAVAALGGPYLTDRVDELAAARAAGLQGALLIQDSGSSDLLTAVAAALQTEAEIIAIRTSALRATESDRALQISRLAAALTAGEGRHRMLICVDAPLAPISGAEWDQLPAESLLIDPIADPDAWRAAATLPGDRGLILALVGSGGDPIEAREVLLWGLQYATSLGGRGGLRVGFTERPTRMLGASERSVVSAAAGATLNALADLLRLTAADAETLKRELDPRSISPAASHLAARKRE
jgi:hypothetical protein